MPIKAGKKQYHVTLNEESTERVIRILGLANQSLSGYLATVIDEFSSSIDDSGFSEVLDKGVENLKAVDALSMIGKMLKGFTFNEKAAKKKK